MDDPKAPPTPYREGKPLAEIIPPDRRVQKTVTLIVASMIAGVAVWLLGGVALDALRAEPVPPGTVPATPGYVAGRVPASTLRGPGGSIAMPPRTRAVINVWLQGCQDCMPAFEAMRELEDHGGLGVSAPIVNVSYGEADPLWARRYGVSANLVFDQGGTTLVRPLGIGTFTTLVVEPDGSIIHRDRPDRPGYRQRVRAALGVPNDDDPTPVDDDPSRPVTPLEGEGLDVSGVQRVLASHRAGLKRQCWDSVPPPKPQHVAITVALTIDATGHVSQISSSGDEPAIRSCLERNIESWVFPAPGADTRVSVPFRFATE